MARRADVPTATANVDGDAPGELGRTRPANNAAYLAVANLGAKLFSLVFVVYALQALGSGLYGNFTDVNAFVGLFAFVTDLGLSTLAVREVAHDRSQAVRYVSNVLALRLVLAAADIVLIVVLTHLFTGKLISAAVRNSVYVYALSLAPLAVTSTLQLVFQFSERLAYSAVFSVATSAVRVALSIGVLMMGHHVLALMMVFTAVTTASAAVMAWIVYTRFLPLRFDLDLAWWPSLLRRAAPFVLLALLNILYYRADMQILYVLSRCGSAAVCKPVGQYGAAYQVLDVLQLVFVGSIQAATFPAFARVAAESREALIRVVGSSTLLMLLLGIPVALLGSFYAPEALHVLSWRSYEQYRAAAPALAMLFWAFPLFLVLSVFYNALWAVHRQQVVTRAFAVTLVSNVLLNVLLIPRFSYMASSALTVASEALNGVLIIIPLWRSVGRLRIGLPAAKIAAITLLAAAVLWVARPFGILIGVPLGVVVMLLGLRLARIMGATERDVLQRLPVVGRYAGLL